MLTPISYSTGLHVCYTLCCLRLEVKFQQLSSTVIVSTCNTWRQDASAAFIQQKVCCDWVLHISQHAHEHQVLALPPAQVSLARPPC
jgi:hypothetical protein